MCVRGVVTGDHALPLTDFLRAMVRTCAFVATALVVWGLGIDDLELGEGIGIASG